MPAPIVFASNRGPVSFTRADDGRLQASRGAGGLVSAVGDAAGGDAVWVCAALREADRWAARAAPGGRLDLAGHDTGGLAVRMLDIEEGTFNRAYNGVANSTLWFVHHLLYDTAHSPVFDQSFRRQWQAYIDYNRAFTRALAEEAAPGARVLVQDYHLTLVPGQLRELRPDLAIAHFTHTPWAPPVYLALLPDDVARTLLCGLLGADVVGFHSPRWAQAFADCCDQLLNARFAESDRTVTVDGRRSRLRVHPLGVDAATLAARAADADVRARHTWLRERLHDRRVLLRIDRTELSKNIVRGLYAYRELLREWPQWQGQVTHVVFAYPSRHDLPEYREYTAEVQRVAQSINDELATADWTPLLLEVSDDYPRSLAAYQLADVLVVNPVRDGMNLVAKEGPVLSENGLALVLSREAGAVEELRDAAFVVNPFDVTGTARAMHHALLLPDEQRIARCRRLAARAVGQPPSAWVAAQLADLADH